MRLRSTMIALSIFFLASPAFMPAQEGARVEFFSPQGTVKKVRQVTARFSEQIVPFGDPRAFTEPFDINCPEKGTERWADGRNWIYDFERDLPAGIRCDFSVKPDLKTLSGKEIAGQKRFAFSTGGPAILSSTPHEGSTTINEDQVFILELDAEATEASLLANVSFSIEGLYDRVGIRILSGEEREQILKSRYRKAIPPHAVVIQSKQTFPAKAKVSLIWGKGVVTKSGVATEQDQILHFQTRGPFTAEFRCQRENPRKGCVPITPMYLTFSAPVSWEQASKIVLKGPTGKRWKAESRERDGEVESSQQEAQEKFVYSVVFRAPFPESTRFTIEIPSALTDDAGRKLSNASRFPLTVRTEEYPPLAKFPGRFGILEWKADPVLPVTLRNIEPEVKARMLTLSKDDGVVEKVKGIVEELKGRVFRLPLEKSEEITYWLRRVDRADRDRNLRGVSVFGPLEEFSKAKEFSIPKPNGAKAFEVVGIPLKERGLYVVEIESEILGASLIGKGGTMFVSTAVLVTNLSAHLKWGRESSLVWVTTLDQANPVKDSLVKVRDCEGKLLWEGRTDANGMARMGELSTMNRLPNCSRPPDPYHPLNQGLFVTAETSDDMTFVHSSWSEGIEPWRFQLPYGLYRGPTIAHTIFDRTLLRAGETVQMKHVLRKHIMQGFSHIPDSDRPKAVSVQHSGSEQKYEFPLKWDANGIAETTWAIPKEAKLGFYNVVLLKQPSKTQDQPSRYYGYTDGWYSGQFRVEEFRVPLMKATVQPPSEPLINVSEAPVDLAVSYLAGGGAGNLAVKLRSQVQPRSVAFDDFDDFTFGSTPLKEGVSQGTLYEEYFDEEGEPSDSPDATKKPKIQITELTLDKSGGARTTISNLPKAKMPQEILAELEFRDPNGEVQTVSSRIALWPAKRLVGIKPDSWALSKDSLKFHVAVANLSGHPIADAPVQVELFQRKTFSHRKRLVGGFYAYEHFEEIKKVGTVCEGKTEKTGRLMCEGKSPVSGNVILQAKITDDVGNETVANRDVWVAGKSEWWFAVGDHDRMDVIAERKRYEPGETARFQVRMPFREATALVTIEREGIIEAFTTKISGSTPVIEIPIKGHYAPNVFVSVLAVRGRVSGMQPTATVDLARPAYKLGIAEINVGWRAHELKVSLSTDRKAYRVREKAQVRIAVKTTDGKKPPPGSEVALAAVDEGLLELMPNQSWQLLQAMMGKRGYEVFTATAQMHIIGKRHFGLKALPQGGGGGKRITRELFDTLLLWKGRVLLDENGEASVEIPLNDSLTSFRIVAVAIGGVGLFGTGSTSIRSTQELMLLSALAPVVRERDKFRSEFTLRNTTQREMEVNVSGRVQRLGKPLKPLTVSLSPGEAKEIGWNVVAPVGAASLIYEIDAKEKSGSTDRIRVAQRVVPAVAVRTFQATITQLEKDFVMAVERPKDAIQGRGGVNVLVRPTLVDGMEGIAEYMKLYPYTCLEQRVSQAVALRDPGRWKQVVAVLPSHLDADGLAKYFPLMIHGSDILTSYIIAIAHEAEWEIPAEIRLKMENALRRFVEGKLVVYSSLPTVDLSIRKLAALDALSRSGSAEARHLTSIAIEPNLWPTSAVIDWFNILQRVQDIPNRQARIREAEQILRSRLNFQGTTMGFSTEKRDFLWWLMVSTDMNAVRTILSFLEAEQWKEDMPRLVRGALGRQKRGRWDLTTANAWGVLAMEKFSRTFEKTPVSGASSAMLAGKSQSVDWKDAPKGKTLQFVWPAKKEEISVIHKGPGKPWATVQSLAAIPLREPFSSGYKIKKTWTAIEQKKPGKWTKGDLVRVTLQLEAQSDMTWVVVNDPIPAGASILGGGLGRDSKLATQGERHRGQAWPAFEEHSFEAFRGYYEFVPKGEWTVEYTIRLNSDGLFQLPTTRVEALYSPEMFGEIPNKSMEVHP